MAVKHTNVKHTNMDVNVVKDFGSEWSRFDQSSLSAADQAEVFEDYFHIFPWVSLPPSSIGADIGCGVPCISNSGVGDTESILEGENVRVVLRSFDDDAHAQGVQALLRLIEDGETKSRCIRVANQYFALEQSVKAYDQIYRGLC